MQRGAAEFGHDPSRQACLYLPLPPPALSERQRSRREAWHQAASRQVTPQARSSPFPCQMPMPWGAPFLMAAGWLWSIPTVGTPEPQTQRCGAPTDTPELESSPRGAFLGCWEGGARLGHPWEHTCASGRSMHPQPCVPSAGRYQSIPRSQPGSLEAWDERRVQGDGEGEERHHGLRY